MARTERTAGGGTFHCPSCDAERGYGLVTAEARRTLFGLPLGRFREVGRTVRCETCRMDYAVDVLYGDDERFARRVEAALREGLRGLIVRMVVEDGKVEMEERAILNRVHADLLGRRLEDAELTAEIAAAAADPRPAADFARGIATYLDSDGRALVLRAALRVAASDGELHPAERNLLAEIGAALELEPHEIEEVMAGAPGRV